MTIHYIGNEDKPKLYTERLQMIEKTFPNVTVTGRRQWDFPSPNKGEDLIGMSDVVLYDTFLGVSDKMSDLADVASRIGIPLVEFHEWDDKARSETAARLSESLDAKKDVESCIESIELTEEMVLNIDLEGLRVARIEVNVEGEGTQEVGHIRTWDSELFDELRKRIEYER